MTKFVFYESYYKTLSRYSDTVHFRVYTAIMEYMFHDKEPNLDGFESGVFYQLKHSLDEQKQAKNKQKTSKQ